MFSAAYACYVMRFRISRVFANRHIHEFQTVVVVGIQVIRQSHVVNRFGGVGSGVFCVRCYNFVVSLLIDQCFQFGGHAVLSADCCEGKNDAE